MVLAPVVGAVAIAGAAVGIFAGSNDLKKLSTVDENFTRTATFNITAVKSSRNPIPPRNEEAPRRQSVSPQRIIHSSPNRIDLPRIINLTGSCHGWALFDILDCLTFR